MFFQDFASGCTHWQLPTPGTFYFAARAVQLCSAILGAAELPEPLRTFVDDVWNIAERLDVVDGRRLPPEARRRRIRRLGSRIGTLAFKCVQHTGLFPAHIPARAEVKVQFEAIIRAENVAAEILRFVRLCGRPRKPRGSEFVFATQENIGYIGSRRISRKNDAFDELVGIALHEHAILECARFHLVGVCHEVSGMRRIFRNERPLQPAGKARPAAAPEIRILDLLDDLLRAHAAQRLSQRLITARALVRLAIRWLTADPNVLREWRLHGTYG